MLAPPVRRWIVIPPFRRARRFIPKTPRQRVGRWNLPRGAKWDAVVAQVQESLDRHGVSRDTVEIVRYDPVVPKAFDTAAWLTTAA